MPLSFIKALDNAVKGDLLNWRDEWFVCLLISTGVVAIGLLFELPELALEIRHIRQDRRDRNMFFVTSHHEAPPKWKILAFVGWFLIVLGVAGEGVFEMLVSRVDGQVQTLNNVLFESTQKEATAAAMALEAPMLPRHLSYIQKKFLSNKISHFRDHEIQITCFNGLAEAVNFERDFIEVLNGNPDKAACLSGYGGMEYTPPIEIDAGAERKGDAEILLDALTDVGINKRDIVVKIKGQKRKLLLIIGPQANS